jgi:Methyltransferase domain
MAFLAHQYLGSKFGSLYDISTILILAFAGASAMAGLLNLIPRYLPRLGMAPEWALASRPLVLVFMGIAFLVTLLFHANVDAQGGAYATGVLVLITSAAFAVTLHVWHKGARRYAFAFITIIFSYTTALNIYERPEGLKISSLFIVVIIASSLLSRALRSTELRILSVELSPEAIRLIAENEDRLIPIHADARSLPFAAEFFDAIVCIDWLPVLRDGRSVPQLLSPVYQTGQPSGDCRRRADARHRGVSS